jgi:hypothetical protein
MNISLSNIEINTNYIILLSKDNNIIYHIIIYMKIYFPYKSDKPNKKYYIITNDNKNVYFGQASASDFTIHKDEARKQRSIDRHKKNEFKYWNKSGIDTASFWSRFLLWNLTTISSSYQDIKKRFNI